MLPTAVHGEPKEALNRRLEAIGWGLFLIMSGAVWFIPGWNIPVSLWLIATGLILLGVNGVRYLNDIRMCWESILLGLPAVICGVGSFVGVNVPFFPLLLILFGAGTILRPWLDRLLEQRHT